MVIAIVGLAAGAALAQTDAPPIRALERYPYLAEFFPYGFWYAQAPHDEMLAGKFGEDYTVRRQKLYHHLARHHNTMILTANRLATPESLAAAVKYGMGQVSSAEFLHSHVKHSGELTGESTMQQVLEYSKTYVLEARHLPGLLAYIVYDEPRPAVAPKIQQVLDEFRKIDPTHPAIYTQSNMPLDELGCPVEWNMIANQDVMLSDCYALAARSGRDPWLYGDVYIPEMRRANPDALQWPIVQAFTKPFSFWALPTPAELRVQVYHTIASGAKGMVFFTNNTAYMGPWSRRQWFYGGAGNPWFGSEPLMDEIGRMGAHLTTAGPLLIPLRYADDYPVTVAAAASPTEPPPVFHAYVLGDGAEVSGIGIALRASGELVRPAIHVGAFAGENYDVLVVHNDDPWKTQRASVTIASGRQHVWDLLTLRSVELEQSDRGATFSVSFEPGDGRLYLAGAPPAAAEAIMAVQRRRNNQSIRLLKLDSEIAARGGIDVTDVEKAIAGRTLLSDPAPERAAAVIGAARVALRQAEDANHDYAAVRHAIEAARADLTEVDQWFRTAVIWPHDQDSDKRLRDLNERVFIVGKSFAAAENRFRQGTIDVPGAQAVRREVGLYKDEVTGYLPAELTERNIAVIELAPDSEPGDVEARALHERLRWMFTHVTMLTANARGAVVNVGGAPANLDDYDLVWIHVGGRSSAARSNYCVTAELAPGVPHDRTAEQLRQYLDAGGGLVLSGLAACMTPDLRLEAYGPNQCYWGTMVVPGRGPSRHTAPSRPTTKSLGLRPIYPAHPLFANLPAEGFETMQMNAAELVTQAVWHRPRSDPQAWRRPVWPQKGRVLAGYWTDDAEIADNHAAVVEYDAGGGGKVILLGGAFDPRVTTNRPRRGEHYDQLIRNTVDYIAKRVSAGKVIGSQ